MPWHVVPFIKTLLPGIAHEADLGCSQCPTQHVESVVLHITFAVHQYLDLKIVAFLCNALCQAACLPRGKLRVAELNSFIGAKAIVVFKITSDNSLEQELYRQNHSLRDTNLQKDL